MNQENELNTFFDHAPAGIGSALSHGMLKDAFELTNNAAHLAKIHNRPDVLQSIVDNARTYLSNPSTKEHAAHIIKRCQISANALQHALNLPSLES